MISRIGCWRNESSRITTRNHSRISTALHTNDYAAPRRADEVIEQTLNVPEHLRGHVMVAENVKCWGFAAGSSAGKEW